MPNKLLWSLLLLLLWASTLVALPEAEAFNRPDFRGARLYIAGEWTVHHRHAPWNDAINAIIVPRGYEAVLYEHAGFRGERIVVRGDWSAHDDPYWLNRISSVQLLPIAPPAHVCGRGCGPDCHLSRGRGQGRGRGLGNGHPGRGRGLGRGQPEVLLFQDTDFRGPLLRLRSDWSAREGDAYWNDNISSIRVPRAYALIVYEHAGFQGRSFTIRGNWSAWGFRDFWNDRISSVRLVRE